MLFDDGDDKDYDHEASTIMLIMKMQSHIFSNVDKFLGLENIHREGFHNSVHFVQLLVHLLFSGDGLNFKKNTNVLTVYVSYSNIAF